MPRLFAKAFLLLRRIALMVMALVCVAIFYIAVIMGDSPELQRDAEEQAAVTPQPTAAPLPGGVRSVETTDLAQITALFPARLAVLPNVQGFVLESGKVEDIRLKGTIKICRVVTLVYFHSALQEKVAVISAVPGVYMARYSQKAFTLETGTVAFGKLQAMALTTEDQRCYVAVQGEAVYAVEGPSGLAGLANVPGWVSLTGGS